MVLVTIWSQSYNHYSLYSP